MKFGILALTAIVFLMLFVTVTFSQPPDYTLEREHGSWCDEMRFVIVPGAEAQMVTLMCHDVDAGWPPNPEDIQTLIEAGYIMTSTGIPPIWTCCTGPYDGQPGVLGWVNMEDEGGISWHNIWGKLYSRREYEDGTPYPCNIWLMDGDPITLNPLTSNPDNAWQVLSLVYSTLLQKNPYTHELMEWCVTEMPTVQPWNGTHREVSPGVWVSDPSPVGPPTFPPIVGEYMKWELRSDMTWHDGTPVTAYDVEFCLDLLVNQNNAKYAAIHTLIHDVNVVETFTFEIYYLAWSATAHIDISSIALLAPKHIWKPYIDGPDNILWNLDDKDHRFWDGTHWIDEYGYEAPIIDTPSGTEQLTHLQGNGPFVYPYGGWQPGVSIRLVRWPGWHFRRILRGDNNLDGFVDILDVRAPLHAFGHQPGMPKWLCQADMANPSALIDGRDIEVVYKDWGKYWYSESTLPP